jgi:hypothetical protein
MRITTFNNEFARENRAIRRNLRRVYPYESDEQITVELAEHKRRLGRRRALYGFKRCR